ncbi:hypothetical protein BTVI_48773 [Pitangus sulphuratus]|nr:hypothetical protein BTVI_48773 [Pitangus sulphuratus]
MEYLILKAIFMHKEDKKAISCSPRAFTKSKSCLTNLIDFYNETATWMDEGRQVDIIYLDFSKAFATVSHNILMGKLRNCGLDEGKESVPELKDKRQWAETDTQELPPEHKEELLCCADQALEGIAQRDCGVSLTGDIQETFVCNPVPCAPGQPCLNREVGLDDPLWSLPTSPTL